MSNKVCSILSFIASAALLFAGCRRVDNVVWSKYASIPEEGWDPVNVIPFFPWPNDSITTTSDRYSLLVSVRFAPTKCPAPLHIVLRQEDDEGHERSDTMLITMRIPEVTPTGRGAYGVYEQTDTAVTGITLRPGYCVELQTLSHPANTSGLLDIGLILSLENGEESFINRIKHLSII